MNRDVCEHFNPVDLPCEKCSVQKSTLREAAQQALEALLDDPNKLVQISEHHWESKRDLAVIALRAALAEPVHGIK